MKIIALTLVAACLWYNQTETVTLKYHIEGLDDKIVQRSISQWDCKEISWKRVFSYKEADIRFKLTTELEDRTRYGEMIEGEIRINSKHKFTPKNLTNLISHEIGHYFFLNHNSNARSIMNNKTSLERRMVTAEDIEDIQPIKLRAIIAKIRVSSVDFCKQ